MSPRPISKSSTSDRTATPRPVSGVKLGVLGDDFILFAEPQQRVYQLDAKSGSVWLRLLAGEAPGRIARQVAGDLRCTLKEAEDYLSRCLVEWDGLGFLGEDAQVPALPEPQRSPEQACASADGDVYSLAGTRIAISFPDIGSRRAWDAIAGHLQHGASAIAEAQLAVERVESGYRIVDPSGNQLYVTDPAAVAVSLKEAVLHTVLELRPDWIALHAAALLSGSGSILLAGSSGHGKTTLAAVLNASGMPVIAEDVALVSPRIAGIRGLPYAFAAKPGSWDIFQGRFTSLELLPEFHRPDGRVVKYIEPIQIHEGESIVRAIIFPRFSTAARLRITHPAKTRALISLLEEAINAGQRLTAEGFAALCSLVDDATVIGIEYGDASMAAEWIKAEMAAADQPQTP